ncbi:MAG: SpoIIE family protein phosphatase, partial [Fibrobacteria bacterium]|nr:SpoIIE family protein phosphatase [Fibrobacteria bacterium]
MITAENPDMTGRPSVQLFNTVEFSKNQLEAIFDHLEPMCLISQDLKVIRLNKAMAEFLGKDFKECLNLSIEEIFSDWDFSMITANVNLVLSSRRPLHVNEYEMLLNGKKSWFEISFHPIDSGEELPSECILTFNNITELVLTKRILLEQYKKLEDQQTIVENKHALLIETRKSLDQAYQAIMDELNVAQEVQQGIMPSDIPNFPGVEFFASYEPIRQVGGDIYDILDLGEGKVGVFIGDVSGHGLAAAFVGAMVKMALIDHAYQIHSPKALFSIINRNLIQHLKSGHYLTAFYGILDINDYTFLYSKASHPQPILIRKSGQLIKLETNGMFLGMIESPGYEEKKIQLQEGDRLYFFTDGYFEIRDVRGKQFMYSELARLIRSVNKLHREEAHTALVDELEVFNKSSELEDDRTFLIMEINNVEDRTHPQWLHRFTGQQDYISRIYATDAEFNLIFKEMEKYLLKHVADEEKRKKFLISAIELANNALEHGNKYDSSKKIEIAYCATPDIIQFAIRDEGEGFTPKQIGDPRIRGNWQRERGRGIFIVKAYMDKVMFNDK